MKFGWIAVNCGYCHKNGFRISIKPDVQLTKGTLSQHTAAPAGCGNPAYRCLLRCHNERLHQIPLPLQRPWPLQNGVRQSNYCRTCIMRVDVVGLDVYSGCHVQNTARCHTFATLWYVVRSFRDLLFSVFNLTWSFSDRQSETQWSNSDSCYTISQLGLAGDAVEVEANLTGDLWRCSKCCCTRWPMASHISALGWDAKLTGWGKMRQEGKMQENKQQNLSMVHTFDAISVITLTVSFVLFLLSFQASQIRRMDRSSNYQHPLFPLVSLVDEDVFACDWDETKVKSCLNTASVFPACSARGAHS